MLGAIQCIEEIHDINASPVAPLEGKGGSLGLAQMIGNLVGCSPMDGYKVKTDQHEIYALIDNAQSCCENWGYFASEDTFDEFIGAELQEVNLTDVALNKQKVEKSDYYDDGGGIQFVDFVTDKGTFQLAVYNAHNGYYGHGILIARDNHIILKETL